MDVKLAALIKSLNIMEVIFSGFTVSFQEPFEEVCETAKVHELNSCII